MTVRPAFPASERADAPRAPQPSKRVAWVAHELDMDPREVRQLVTDGVLQGHKKGKRGIRIYVDSVAAYQESREFEPKAPAKKLQAARASVSRARQSAARRLLLGTRILS